MIASRDQRPAPYPPHLRPQSRPTICSDVDIIYRWLEPARPTAPFWQRWGNSCPTRQVPDARHDSDNNASPLYVSMARSTKTKIFHGRLCGIYLTSHRLAILEPRR